MSDTKFCKGCRFIDPAAPLHKIETACLHPSAISNPILDLVTGEPMQRAHAWQMRGPKGLCGPDGRLFELNQGAR